MMMKLNHGSTMIIRQPIVAAGRPNLDFGQGFYLTDLSDQAESWADRMQRINLETGVVNVYELDIDSVKAEFSYYRFDRYDKEWLDFIVANRMGRDNVVHYDVIEGGVANDRVIDTIEAYMANMMPIDVALRELARHQPNNQICITNQAVLDKHLMFIDSYNI